MRAMKWAGIGDWFDNCRALVLSIRTWILPKSSCGLWTWTIGPCPIHDNTTSWKDLGLGNTDLTTYLKNKTKNNFSHMHIVYYNYHSQVCKQTSTDQGWLDTAQHGNAENMMQGSSGLSQQKHRDFLWTVRTNHSCGFWAPTTQWQTLLMFLKRSQKKDRNCLLQT